MRCLLTAVFVFALLSNARADYLIINSLLGERTVEVPNLSQQPQEEVARQAALFALSPEGWDLAALGGILAPFDGRGADGTHGTGWSGGREWAVVDINGSLSNHFGWDLNDEALQNGGNRNLMFHTDDTISRGRHDVGEPSSFGIISGFSDGNEFQLGLRNWGSFQVLLAGDTNSDGLVDLTDVNNVLNNFAIGEFGGPPVFGEAWPFDGVVDLGDLNLVRNHFGDSFTLSAAVPEPTMLVLALLCVSVMPHRLRRLEQ